MSRILGALRRVTAADGPCDLVSFRPAGLPGQILGPGASGRFGGGAEQQGRGGDVAGGASGNSV